MSEQAKGLNCTCHICGHQYRWVRGADHNCIETFRAQVEELKKLVEEAPLYFGPGFSTDKREWSKRAELVGASNWGKR